MSLSTERPLAILYEHPTWFVPLFETLERRGLPYRPWHVDEATFGVPEDGPGPADGPASANGPAPASGPANSTSPRKAGGGADAGRAEFSALFNRISPSAYTRGNATAIHWTLEYLERARELDVPVINGYDAFRTEISKARQLGILTRLGLGVPRSRVVHRPEQVPQAAEAVGFPIVVKPNVGGSGAGIVRFDDPAALQRAVEAGELQLGFDDVGIVQEYVAPADGSIVRVEVVGGRYLYAIRIHLPAAEAGGAASFNLCPASISCTTGGDALERTAYGDDAPESEARVEAHDPPPEAIGEVERAAAAAGIEVGGVEYLVAGDGRRVYYDINALSNFVTDAPRVVGFDPFERLVDYLVERAGAKGREQPGQDHGGPGRRPGERAVERAGREG